MSIRVSSPLLGRELRGPVEHQVAAVLAMHLVERAAHLLLHPLEPAAHALQLVLHREHALDAGEVQSELRRQSLDQPQPLDIPVGVQARVARRALRANEAPLLIDAQRLRMHADELGRDADHVARTVGHD